MCENFVTERTTAWDCPNLVPEFLGRDWRETFWITRATASDIPEIQALEQEVEGVHAADQETLLARLNMFQEGFLVARRKSRIVGYLQSMIRRGKPFHSFREIQDFPRDHTLNGNELYLIFLAVCPGFRSLGVAGRLLSRLTHLARKHSLERISLVAKEELIPFYESNGFEPLAPLPDFLPKEPFVPYLMHKRLA